MEIKENISLKPFNSFGLDVKARYMSAFSSVEEIREILSSSYAEGPAFVLGGGSNIVFTKDLDALVLKNEIRGIEVISEDEDHIYIKSGAGVNWHQFVMYCVENGLAGVENLSLIPGNVGASPIQNIGAYGVEIKDVFLELEAFHIKEKYTKTFTLQECNFGYRESVFKNSYKGEYIITRVSFRLNKKPVFNTSYGAIQQELEKNGIQDLSIKAISDAVISIRSSKLPDPSQIGNAGSFFKNPVVSADDFNELRMKFPDVVSFPSGNDHYKIAAGWLIEQCGWKGYRKGDAGCYSKQALVLVNYGNANGQEIFELSEQIISSVRKKFNVQLEREVNII
jgi:UDP-N-acetylmuramate dehydrogenase